MSGTAEVRQPALIVVARRVHATASGTALVRGTRARHGSPGAAM
jgi:hypothetical protein